MMGHKLSPQIHGAYYLEGWMHIKQKVNTSTHSYAVISLLRKKCTGVLIKRKIEKGDLT